MSIKSSDCFENRIKNHFQCSCGKEHQVNIKSVLIEKGAINTTGDLIKESGYQRILLVGDNNTYEVCGGYLESILLKENLFVQKHIFDREKALIPDETAIVELFLRFPKDIDLIIAVGSGTINDICRLFSYKMQKPYWIVATAPSMDGFASTASPLLIHNLKTTYYFDGPEIIIGDIDVLKNAPEEMIIAGIGDLFGKYTALLDWKLGNIITGEYYCVFVADMMKEVVDNCMKLLESNQDKEKMIKNLMEGLVLSGIAMSYVGNSRPASGSEHHLSHFWEMKSIMRGEELHLHGIKVGVATCMISKIYEWILNESIDFEEAKKQMESFNKEQWLTQLYDIYGEAAEHIVKGYSYDPAKRIEYLNSIENNLEKIKNEIQQMLPFFHKVQQILKNLGAPVTPTALHIDDEDVKNAIRYAKEIRERYTVLQFITDVHRVDPMIGKIRSQYCIR